MRGTDWVFIYIEVYLDFLPVKNRANLMSSLPPAMNELRESSS